MNITQFQKGKINPNVKAFYVLISGKDIWETCDTIEKAFAEAEKADAEYPKEIIWISDSFKCGNNPWSALDEFNG